MSREALGIVGAVAGAVVGAYMGNPVQGAQWGFMIGSTVGGILYPTQVQGPGLSEAPIQTSRDGVPIIMIWGLHHCHGNIIQKNPEVQVTTTESQGKGGGTEVTTTRRFRTFAIGICRGPIAEVTRIWENDRLVYDVRSSPAIPTAETTAYAEGIVIYNGSEEQLPDPELESHWGVGTTPAYRGLAYIVWVDKDLTDFGGSIPQFRFEVNGSRDATITSKPYPIDAVEELSVSADLKPVEEYHWTEGLSTTITLLDSILGATLEQYTNWPPEGLSATIVPQAGTLVVALEQYTNWPPEGLQATITIEDGTLVVALVAYINWPPEGLQATITVQDGTLI